MNKQIDIFGQLSEICKPMESLPEFFNTVNLKGSDLKEAKASNNRQNERVLNYFMQMQKPLTPLAVHRWYIRVYPAVPECSIKRAITTLTDGGWLVKLDDMVKESYGKPNHQWRLK